MITSSCPVVNFTKRNSSSGFKLIAILPLRLIFSNSDTDVRFTIPFFVTNNNVSLSSSLGTATRTFTFSPFSKVIKLTIGIPLDVLDPLGTLYPFNRYTRPLSVNNNKKSCVDIEIIVSIESSSFNVNDLIPRPPRF